MNTNAERSYEAALIKGSYSSPNTNTEASPYIRLIRNVSREMAKNNPIYSKYLYLIKDNVIGSSGIQLQIRLMKRPRGGSNTAMEPHNALNEQIEAAWSLWSKSCDIRGYDNFRGIQMWVANTLVRDGEAIIHHGIRDGNLVLETLESDLLDLQYNQIGRDDRWLLGVRLNDVNRPTEYAILTKHPEDVNDYRIQASSKHRFLKASEMLHVFRRDYSDQVRGFPWASSSLVTMAHAKEYLKNQLIRARILSSITYFLNTSNPEVINKIGRKAKSTDASKP